VKGREESVLEEHIESFIATKSQNKRIKSQGGCGGACSSVGRKSNRISNTAGKEKEANGTQERKGNIREGK
jgi:hypothetical protein